MGDLPRATQLRRDRAGPATVDLTSKSSYLPSRGRTEGTRGRGHQKTLVLSLHMLGIKQFKKEQ